MRYRLTLALGVLATALVAALAPGAGAATNTSISISSNAQLITPTLVQVGFHYRCDGGIGVVSMTVSQSFPESTGASGSDAFIFACDGRTHEAAISVFGCCYFDAGKATATGTLTDPSGNTATDGPRTIKIVVT